MENLPDKHYEVKIEGIPEEDMEGWRKALEESGLFDKREIEDVLNSSKRRIMMEKFLKLLEEKAREIEALSDAEIKRRLRLARERFDEELSDSED